MVDKIVSRRAQPSETRELVSWIKERHYLHSAPPGFVFVLEFLIAGKRVGGAILGRPTSRKLDANLILEVNRFFLTDECPANSESFALALIRNHIRKWYPQIKLLISYSDPQVGHTGGIYLADNWCPFGTTNSTCGHGWKSRNGRRNDPVSPKQRWVRTP